MKQLNKNKSLVSTPHWRYNSLMVAMALSSVSSYGFAQSLPVDEPIIPPKVKQSDATQSIHLESSSAMVEESDDTPSTEYSITSATEQEYTEKTIQQNQRLSHWLLAEKQQQPADDYDFALVWKSIQEQPYQAQKQQQLQQKLQQLAEKNQNLRPFVHWIAELPATGRVNLPKQDARYLEVNPQIDPILKQGDKVQRYVRPNHVTVLFDDLRSCKVQHQAGIHARAYVESCSNYLQKTQKADDGYLISPDGNIERITLSTWNAKAQSSPTPASWLWIPSQKSSWSKSLKHDVAQFLATQGIGLHEPTGNPIEVIALKNTLSNTATRDVPTTNSDWGVTGLLQTPTARMPKQGTASLNIAHADPYTQYNIRLQPFDWLETAVRYTNIKDVSYGAVSPNQDYKDKSLDVKLRLWQEDKWLPQVAVGWRDPAGTSLFGGEYVVANKRYGDFDFSLGMGWGYLGGRANLSNPIGAIAKRYKTRVAHDIGQGGKISPKSWFTGQSSLFGGIQWHSPYQPLSVKVEYDGNDYKNDYATRMGKKINVEHPINFGVTWQHKGVELSAGLERGNTAMFAVSLNGDLSTLGQVKNTFVQPSSAEQNKKASIVPSSLSYKIPLEWFQSADASKITQSTEILHHLSQATGWQVYKITEQDGKLTVYAENQGGVFLHERLVQVGEILSKVAPKHTKLMQVELTRQGETINRFSITPQTWQAHYQQFLPSSQRSEQAFQVNAEKIAKPSEQMVNSLAEKPLSRGHILFAPTVSQSLGGPNGYLFGLYATVNANYRLWQGAWLNATGQLRVVDNYNKYTYTADSQLQRVRTNIRDYMTKSRVLIPNLQWTQFKQLGNNLYGLAYAGYLESMFAGVGGEILYRPAQGRWAIGADVNRVRQRDFKQHFALQDYKVNTGHVNLYWNMPWYDVTAKLSAGRYLAGDRGATLDLSRTFKNGVKMGAWATKTNVTAEQFGEGSMDKGVYVSIPFDALFRAWSTGATSLVYQPLIRDGGAKLNRAYQLYDLTSTNSNQALWIENPKGR